MTIVGVMTEHQAVGEAVRARMEARRMNPNAVAAIALIPYTSFKRKLAGGTAFTLPEFLRICGALNCAPEELLAEIAAA